MRVAILIAAGLLASPAGAQSPEPAAPPKPVTLTEADARAAVTGTLDDVEAIRGLVFKKPVPVKSIGDAKARDYVVERVKRFLPDGALHAQERAWALLGLLPPGTRMLDAYLDALEEQAGGFYDPPSKSFFLLDDMPAALAPVLAAHELTHALEDQYYDLDRRLEQTAKDDDRSFAVSAVHEGSATIVMTLYTTRAMLAGTMKAADLQAFAQSEAGKAEKLKALPPALSRQLVGPYVLGMLFLERGDVSRLAQGFPKDDVEHAYKDGPASSEQVLHPEKYWDPAKRDLPKKVKIAGIDAALGGGWTKAGDGVLGELTIGVLVGANTPDTSSNAALAGGSASWTNAAASGWGGDRWELWVKGEAAVTVLATVWDTPKDAEEFAAALPARPGFAWRISENRVGVVAGDAGERGKAVLEALAP